MKAGLIASTLALATTAFAKTPKVSVKGNAFYTDDGKRFYVKGVDYQPGGASDAQDPIAKLSNCRRDIKEFQKLNINTVRIYSVDNSVNHDECMKELSDAGIYLALDVNTSKYSINRNNPRVSYNYAYLQHIFATVDAFAKYDNTLLFFAGNEVINKKGTTNTAPWVKAVQRDLKQYIKAQGYRQIPVGYSAADVAENQYQTALYFNCGGEEQRGDFFAFNNYEWCSPSSYTKSGWDQKVKQYSDYSIPLFLSEYGCTENPPRPFDEVQTLYSPKMTKVFSGGLVYEYTEEPDKPHAGLVKLKGNSVSELKDFTALEKQLGKLEDPSGDGGAKSSGSASKCPPKSANWNIGQFSGSELPEIPSQALAFMKNGAGPGKGNKGSSQTSGGQTSSGKQDAGSGAAASQKAGAPKSSNSKGAGSVVIPPMSLAPLFSGFAIVLSAIMGANLLL